jgi:integrase/recombinase XerD
MIKEFIDAISMERDLSDNTLDAYRGDLLMLHRRLRNLGIELTDATKTDLVHYFIWRAETGLKPRSRVRQLSSFRRFFRYLKRQGTISTDPTAAIIMPRIRRAVPQVLTAEEVDALRAVPDVTDPLEHRNRVMLEVLLATGLRVSELVRIEMSQIDPSDAALRVAGKLNRERMVRLSDEASTCLQAFLSGPRNEILLEKETDYLFPTRRGSCMTRQAFWHIIKRYAESARIDKKLSPNTLRIHTAAELLKTYTDLRAVQHQLGHRDLSTTRTYALAYTNPSDARGSAIPAPAYSSVAPEFIRATSFTGPPEWCRRPPGESTGC